jgi:sortase A
MISKILLFIGITCLALYGFFTVQARFYQQVLEEEFDQFDKPITHQPDVPDVPSKAPPEETLKEGDLFGRLEIPRLNLSVMVMEGAEDDILRLGAGHVPGTSLAIAGHRDTFFRPLKDIKPYDLIRFSTKEGSAEYRVISTKIVGPKDTWVLDNMSRDTLTLITCYPFYYVGPAPERFIVEATKN